MFDTLAQWVGAYSGEGAYQSVGAYWRKYGNLYDVGLENLALVQLIIPKFILFFDHLSA